MSAATFKYFNLSMMLMKRSLFLSGSSTPVKLRAKGKDIASSGGAFTVLSEKKLFLGQKVGHLTSF